jgi:hypothetical protein
MNGYTFAAIIVVTLGVVAIAWAWHLRKAWSVTVKQAQTTLTRPLDAAESVANNAVAAVRATTEPVSQGVAAICQSFARRIEAKREVLKNIRERITALTVENEQLKNRRISVDQIRPILKLALREVELSNTNCVRKIVKKTQGNRLMRDEEIEYLGVYQVKSTQRLGVDLSDLRYRLVAPTTIEVDIVGKTEVVGNLNSQFKPVIAELRRHLTKGSLAESHEVIKGDIDGLLLEHDRAQRNDLQKAITDNETVNEHVRAIEQAALQFLKDYFHPRGYTVIKAIGKLTDGSSLFQLTDALNARIDDELRARTGFLTEALNKREDVERLLAEDLEELGAVGVNNIG